MSPYVYPADFPTLQAWLNAAKAEGAIAFLPAGVYHMGLTLQVPSGIIVCGVGSRSVLDFSYSEAQPNNSLELAGSIGTVLRDFRVTSSTTMRRNGICGAVRLLGASHCSLEGLEVDHSSTFGIFCDGAVMCRIQGCNVHETYADAISAWGASRGVRIIGNETWKTADAGISANPNGPGVPSFITIQGNHVEDNGIGFCGDHIQVIGNTIKTRTLGIGVYMGFDRAASAFDISHNSIEARAPVGPTNDASIYVGAAQSGLISYNVCSGWDMAIDPSAAPNLTIIGNVHRP